MKCEHGVNGNTYCVFCELEITKNALAEHKKIVAAMTDVILDLYNRMEESELEALETISPAETETPDIRETCPQCGSNEEMYQDRGEDHYHCENCGWPDENRPEGNAG